MNKQRFSTALLVGSLVLFGSMFSTSTSCAQSTCTAPGFDCPVASLFTDGVHFVFATSCCTPDGPVCQQTFSDGLYIYNSSIVSGDFGCEASPGGGSGCACKTSQTAAANGSGKNANGELTFDPDKATAVSTSTGSCDDYFVKIQGADEYYRCFNISYSYQGNVGGGKMAIRASKLPTNFTVQEYVATKSVLKGVNFLTVIVPSSGGDITSTFRIAQKN